MTKKEIYQDVLEMILIFCFLLFTSLITTTFSNDEVWNFGFAFNLYHGLVPYRDFNMIVTPFYPFFMSLLFYLFKDYLLVTIITNILLLIASLFLIKKLIGNHHWLLILVLVFPFSIVYPSYNLLLFYLFVLLLYLETKVSKNDLWIGLLLGLCILTKQTVGFILLFVSFILVFKKREKLLKRLFFCMIPILIFIIYLFCHYAFYDFIDQCFLGMFDFGSKNSNFSIFGILFSLLMIGEVIYFIYKNPKKIENYYILAYYSIMIPMFDLAHIQYAFLGFILLQFFNLNVSSPISKCLTIFSLCVAIGSQLVIFIYLPKPFQLQHSVSHFEYRYIYQEDILFLNEIQQFYLEHSKDKIIILSRETYFAKIALNQKIGKLDLINYGNSGYHGTNQLIKLIQENEDAYFITYGEDICSHSQTDCDVIAYVVQHYDKIGELGVYSIYQKQN